MYMYVCKLDTGQQYKSHWKSRWMKWLIALETSINLKTSRKRLITQFYQCWKLLNVHNLSCLLSETAVSLQAQDMCKFHHVEGWDSMWNKHLSKFKWQSDRIHKFVFQEYINLNLYIVTCTCLYMYMYVDLVCVNCNVHWIHDLMRWHTCIFICAFSFFSVFIYCGCVMVVYNLYSFRLKI